MSDLGFSMCRHEIGGKYNKVLMVGRSWAGLAGVSRQSALSYIPPSPLTTPTPTTSTTPRIGLEELIIVKL